MGIISKVFGGSRRQNRSLVVRWVDESLYRIKHKRAVTPEMLFVEFINILVTFIKPNPYECKIKKEMRKFGFNVDAEFANDCTLFELGCYLYVYFDMWLLAERPYIHDEIRQIFSREFTKLFTHSLQIPNVAQLFQERTEGYMKIARLGSSPEHCHFHLLQLLLRTKNNKKPQAYDFDKAPIYITDVFKKMGLKIKLISWEAAFIPAMIKSMSAATIMMGEPTYRK